MRHLLYLFCFIACHGLAAQGHLYLKVLDPELNEGLFNATIRLYAGDKLVSSTSTDFDGNALFSNLDPGRYDLEVSFTGYASQRVEAIQLQAGRVEHVSVALYAGEALSAFTVIEYEIPLIHQDNMTTGGTVTSRQISNLPTKNINTLASTTAGLAGRAKARGARANATDYYIDGVRVRGTLIPQSTIEQVSVMPPSNSVITESGSVRPPTPARLPGFDASLVEPSPFVAPKLTAVPELVTEPELPAAGQLTAGHWRDIDNQDFWKDMLAEDFDQWKRHWQLYPERVLELELLNQNEQPLIDAEVVLYRQTDNAELWRARTDNTGRVALWIDPTQHLDQHLPVRAEVIFDGRAYPLKVKTKAGRQRERLVVPVGCAVAPVVELAFAIDISGSMSDELSFLQSELADVITRARAAHADKTVRTAAIAYRSPGDAYVTKVSPFTSDPLTTTAFFRATQAIGGSGGAEAVELAFERALELNWSEQAVARILFILLDEPPEHDQSRREKLQRYSREMARRGIKVVPVVSSGAKRDLEYLMRAVSVLTNGTYAFLTDHSGIGDSHLEPAVDSYDVYKLNDLLVKIIADFTTYENCEMLPVVELAAILNSTETTVRLHPNPVTDLLYIDSGDSGDTVVSARLFDATGKVVLVAVAAATQIDVSDLVPGIYFIELQTGKRAWVERVVVAR